MKKIMAPAHNLKWFDCTCAVVFNTQFEENKSVFQSWKTTMQGKMAWKTNGEDCKSCKSCEYGGVPMLLYLWKWNL